MDTLQEFTSLPSPSTLNAISDHILTLQSPFDYSYDTLPPTIPTTPSGRTLIPTLPSFLLYSYRLGGSSIVSDILHSLAIPESYIDLLLTATPEIKENNLTNPRIIKLRNTFGSFITILLSEPEPEGRDWVLDYIQTGQIQNKDSCYTTNPKVSSSVHQSILEVIEVGIIGVIADGSVVGDAVACRVLMVLGEEEKFESLIINVLTYAASLEGSSESRDLLLAIGKVYPKIIPELGKYLVKDLKDVEEVKRVVNELPEVGEGFVRCFMPVCENVEMEVVGCEVAVEGGEGGVFDRICEGYVESFRNCILTSTKDGISSALSFCKTVSSQSPLLKTLPTYKTLLNWMTLMTCIAGSHPLSNSVIDSCILDCYTRRLPNTIDLWKKLEGGGVESVGVIVKVGIREGMEGEVGREWCRSVMERNAKLKGEGQ
ncbi:hypothetical protein TL16_g09992 [Triparma laevis f. inornata]|uniref:Uncharacterized protein n=1 Tax=Triparma laevis f. inornata TaxID=1714386 RepID=A0A9W7B6D2_9STRA|nr:hypothetical protein TL16_g09992 [Triparma laevis f. inornata]